MRTIKIGENRGKGRIWLEGSWLADAGFSRGVLYVCVLQDGQFHISADANGNRRVSGKVKGDKVIPIIDMNGAHLSPFIGSATVNVLPGHLVVTPASRQE